MENSWKNTPHKLIKYPPEMRDAIARAAAAQNMSAHALIQRFISAGLVIIAPSDNNL